MPAKKSRGSSPAPDELRNPVAHFNRQVNRGQAHIDRKKELAAGRRKHKGQWPDPKSLSQVAYGQSITLNLAGSIQLVGAAA